MVQEVRMEHSGQCKAIETLEKNDADILIQQINDVLGWRKFIIPGALIGWVIDAEVAAVRRIQQVTRYAKFA